MNTGQSEPWKMRVSEVDLVVEHAAGQSNTDSQLRLPEVGLTGDPRGPDSKSSRVEARIFTQQYLPDDSGRNLAT